EEALEEYEDLSYLVEQENSNLEEIQESASPEPNETSHWLLTGGVALAVLLLVGLSLYLFFPAGQKSDQLAENSDPSSVPAVKKESGQASSGPILKKPAVTSPKPVEPEPVSSKPAEPKPMVPEPVVSKPAEPESIEPKPVEPKPAQPKRTEPEHREPKLAKSKPVESLPFLPKPFELWPVESKPATTKSAAMTVAAATSKLPEPPAVAKAEPTKEVATQPTMSYERYQAVEDSLGKIAGAFHNLAAIYQAFMPDPKIYKRYYDDQGRLKVSWRVHLLPYLGEEVLFQRFKLDEAWDSPINKAAAKYMPAIYRSPETPTGSNLTRFRGFEDPKIVAPPENAGRSRGRGANAVASMFTAGSTGRMRDIIDGFSNTVFLVEVGPDQAVEWTKPGELDLASASKSVGKTPLGIPTAFIDARIRLLKSDIDDETWRSLIHPADRAKVDIDKLSLRVRRSLNVKAPDKNLAQMKKVSSGLLRFVDTHRRFPPASEHLRKGQQLLSW
ncbi:MAG: DUF1559 domain-containing protein, partial [Planctomycetaceae bacterium]|nr:DUF1559 domain-containing protein [Planctomycetaceae bacterium]